MEWPFEGEPSEDELAHWEAFVAFYQAQLGRTPTLEDVERILASGGESLLLDLVALGKAEFSGVDETGAVTFRFEDEGEGPSE